VFYKAISLFVSPKKLPFFKITDLLLDFSISGTIAYFSSASLIFSRNAYATACVLGSIDFGSYSLLSSSSASPFSSSSLLPPAYFFFFFLSFFF
jgi:hypothetical protein